MSITFAGLYGVLVSFALQFFAAHGYVFAENDIMTTVRVLVALASIGAIYYGRLRKGDIDIFGRRK